MIINNINPVLTKIGSLEIRYYGIIFALGFIIGYFFLRYYIKRGRLDLTLKKLDDLVVYLIVGIIVGARLFYAFFYAPQMLIADPIGVLFARGGLAFHGGLIGAIIAALIFAKKNKIRPTVLFDVLVIPAALGLTFGRIANYTNHELYGPVTNLPWCVVFQSVEGCRHPYQIYASITHFITFLILFYIYSKKPKQGTTFWSFILIYGVFRFLTDFFKVETKYFTLGIGQWASLVMIVLAAIVFSRKFIMKKKRTKSEEE